MILKILERFKPAADPLNVDSLHIEVEATPLAYAARDACVADTAVSRVPVAQRWATEGAPRRIPGTDLDIRDARG